MVTRTKRGRRKNPLMPSQETYLDLYAPLTFAERMGVRNQEIRHTLLFPCWLEVCVDMNVQQRLKRKQNRWKTTADWRKTRLSSYAVSSDERDTYIGTPSGQDGVFLSYRMPQIIEIDSIAALKRMIGGAR